MRGHIINENQKTFVKAGNAIFTIFNRETGNRFTYKVRKHEEKDLWFVGVLSGPDNTSDYNYLGTIFGDIFRSTRKSRITENAQSFMAFKWFNDRLNENNLPESVEVYHEGRCGRCGRRLTVPESVESGYGPECINYI